MPLPAVRPPPAVDPAPPLRLHLLGGFALEIGGRLTTLPFQAQRVLAPVAVHDGPPIARTVLAEQLWPEVGGARAQASLRTALWRLRQTDPRLVTARQDLLQVGRAVEVDVRLMLAQAARLLSPTAELRPEDVCLDSLRADLLPTWDEEWLLLERERVRQQRLHALDALTHRLRARGRYAEAVEAALAALAAEPLRESAQAALIDVHLAEGNVTEAYRQYERYARILRGELGLAPSPAFADRLRLAMRTMGDVAPGRGAAHSAVAARSSAR